jgi:hypothetical protein
MPDTRFEALKLELLKGGVAPVYVARTLLELEEHFRDLELDALERGLCASDAAAAARAALGEDRALAAAVLARHELLEWRVRWPRVACCLRSAAAIGVLPGWPLLFCIEHRPEIARWSAAFGVAAAFVGGILAWLDWLIVVR